MSEIPEAAIEAAVSKIEDLLTMLNVDPDERSGEVDSRTTAQIIAEAALRGGVEHLTPAPQAEGEVREALARVLCTANGFDPDGKRGDLDWRDWVNDADAVLSSGLVVPVGEVERLGSRWAGVTHMAARMTRERDAALAELEQLRASLVRLKRAAYRRHLIHENDVAKVWAMVQVCIEDGHLPVHIGDEVLDGLNVHPSDNPLLKIFTAEELGYSDWDVAPDDPSALDTTPRA